VISLGDLDIERLEDIRRWGYSSQVNKFHAVLRSERADNILLSNETLVDQFPDEAARACFHPRLLDLELGKKSNLPEYFDDEFFVMGHASEVIDHDCGRVSQGQWQLLSRAHLVATPVQN
jgi:hypothetical protein